MENLKELKDEIISLYDMVKAHKGPTGDICFEVGTETNFLTNTINRIMNLVDELEKVQNYNNMYASSMVNHPSHYKGSKFECIDTMLDIFGKEKVSAFCELNAFKYLWRSNHKGTDIQDKEKAAWYLNKYITLKQNQ